MTKRKYIEKFAKLLISHIECTLCIDAGIKGNYSNLWGDGQILNYEDVATCRTRGIVLHANI